MKIRKTERNETETYIAQRASKNRMRLYFCSLSFIVLAWFLSQARDLPAADNNGLMDPYLKIKFAGGVSGLGRAKNTACLRLMYFGFCPEGCIFNWRWAPGRQTGVHIVCRCDVHPNWCKLLFLSEQRGAVRWNGMPDKLTATDFVRPLCRRQSHVSRRITVREFLTYAGVLHAAVPRAEGNVPARSHRFVFYLFLGTGPPLRPCRKSFLSCSTQRHSWLLPTGAQYHITV